MKSTAINALEYTGTVTLSRYTGTKKIKIAQIHNKGGNSLFEFFSDCLLGHFDTASIGIPKKIMLLKEADGVYVRASDATSFINWQTAQKVTDNGEIGVVYSFIVTREHLLKGFTHIGLYSSSTKDTDINDFAAICNVESTDAALTMASALVIDWKLTVSNHPNAIETPSFKEAI